MRTGDWNILAEGIAFFGCLSKPSRSRPMLPSSTTTALPQLLLLLLLPLLPARNSPASLLRDVQSIHPQFQGYQQHDAGELMRCLLSRLHEELMAPHLAHRSMFPSASLPATSSSSSSPSSMQQSSSSPPTATADIDRNSTSSQDVSTTSSQDISEAKQSAASKKDDIPCITSIIHDIFEGTLESHVRCRRCNKVSELTIHLLLISFDRTFIRMIHSTIYRCKWTWNQLR